MIFPNRPIDNKLTEEVYDIDAESESDHENQAAKVDVGTKEGYLLKGPEIGSDRIFSNLASKSFKKRYCSMVREADGAYILEVYKDEKKTDTKLTIVMDFCSDVVKVSVNNFCPLSFSTTARYINITISTLQSINVVTNKTKIIKYIY